MKKMFTLITIMVLVIFSTSYSQWVNMGGFPSATFAGNNPGGHAVAVDPDGKIWLGNYYNVTGDTIFNGTSWVATRAIHVYNPDGSEVSFSPILTITVNGVTDSLIGFTNRGMRTAADGNILVTTGNRIHKINYLTGQGMATVIPDPVNSGTAPAVDGFGNVYTATVVPGNPIKIYSPDLSLYLGNVVDASVGYSRSFEVSADGNTVYWAGYDKNKVKVYSRPDEFSPYELTDSVLFGFQCESMTWSNDRSLLWASCGSDVGGLPNQDPDHVTSWTVGTWYAWNPVTNTIVDSIKTVYNAVPNEDLRPRGLDFSPNGQIAYVAYFGAGMPCFQKFENPTAVDEEGQTVVNGYALSQNYPNPFNPTTKISFELPLSGYTTLKVYDMLGNEVATLVQSELASGSHSVNFDAANFASGTYVYQLNINGTRITNKMVLLK
ncbi:MAG: T9SS type A sorting domain-containing protein [Ignavibacteriales bacterium]|nr:T9SS type A sorting domain-containing protein [Ignavibacteriales bacterium]